VEAVVVSGSRDTDGVSPIPAWLTTRGPRTMRRRPGCTRRGRWWNETVPVDKTLRDDASHGLLGEHGSSQDRTGPERKEW